MPSTISGFNFEELTPESGRGTITQDGTSVRVFKIEWSDLPAFVKALNGGWTAVNSSTWNYTMGDEHPDWPGVMFCDKCDYEPFGRATGISAGKSSWEYAKVTGTYICKKNSFDKPEDIIEEELDFKLERVSIPGSSLKTTDDDSDVPEENSKLMPTLEYTVTMNSVPNLPGATFADGPIPKSGTGGSVGFIYQLLGLVNNAPFKGAAIGQMLFLGAQAKRVTNVFGPQNWKIVLKFLYRPVEWTKVFVSSKGDFVDVVLKVGGEKIYSSGNLASLLPA